MQMEENQPGSAATCSGGMGTDETTLTERLEPNSFGAGGDRLLVHLSSSKVTARPGNTRAATQSSGVFFFLQEAQQVETDTTTQKKEAEQLEFEACLDFRNFRIWQMNYRVRLKY